MAFKVIFAIANARVLYVKIMQIFFHILNHFNQNGYFDRPFNIYLGQLNLSTKTSQKLWFYVMSTLSFQRINVLPFWPN